MSSQNDFSKIIDFEQFSISNHKVTYNLDEKTINEDMIDSVFESIKEDYLQTVTSKTEDKIKLQTPSYMDINNMQPTKSDGEDGQANDPYDLLNFDMSAP